MLDTGSQNLLISIIVATRNNGDFLDQCISSLLAQTMKSSLYEVIVANDNSHDHTTKVLNQFGNSIRVFHNKHRLGLPASLNRAIKESRGQFITRVDGDDYVEANYLTKLYNSFKANPNADGMACNYTLINSLCNPIKNVNFQNQPIGCGILFQKKHIHEIGLYDESFLFHEDKDLLIRFQKRYKIEYIPETLYYYRRHSGNMTNNLIQMIKYKHQLLQKHGRNFT